MKESIVSDVELMQALLIEEDYTYIMKMYCLLFYYRSALKFWNKGNAASITCRIDVYTFC